MLYIPPRYMAADATPEDKEVYEVYKNMMRNIHAGTQSSMILPQVVDENNNEYFKLDVVNTTGNKAYDTSKVIQRFQYEILTALAADFLVLGQSGGGSFALSENKMTVSQIAIEAKLLEIQDQLNHDLVKQLFQLNGWSTDVMPTIEFGSVDKADLDVISKYLQRAGSAGLIPLTPETVKWVCDQAGMPYTINEALGREEFLSMLTSYSSNAGEATGLGGTSTSLSSTDSSVSNTENA